MTEECCARAFAVAVSAKKGTANRAPTRKGRQLQRASRLVYLDI
jgi:hypothetical protein